MTIQCMYIVPIHFLHLYFAERHSVNIPHMLSCVQGCGPQRNCQILHQTREASQAFSILLRPYLVLVSYRAPEVGLDQTESGRR